MNNRIILFHKNKTSARTVFWAKDNSVCLFETLPELTELVTQNNTVVTHPNSVVTQAEQQLGLEKGDLILEPEFLVTLSAPSQTIQVFLAGFTCLDAPHDVAEQHQAKFIAITQARQFPTLELELLRLAYQTIMEG